MAELIKKSIEEVEAELDKAFYDEFTELVKKYKRTFTTQLAIARLTEEDLKK